MKVTVKSAVVAVLLSAASIGAYAAPPTVPAQPAPIPSGGLPNNTASSDPVYAAVWDPLTGASLTEYLGLSAGQIGPTDMTANLDFGVFSGFSSAFASEIAGGTVSSLNFEVFSTATTNAGNTTSIYTTSRNAASNALFDATVANEASAGGAIQAANSTVIDWTVNRMNSAQVCNKVNPCVAPNNNDPRSFALPAYSDNYGGSLSAYGSAAHTSNTLGSSMSFYLLTADNTDIFNPIASDAKYSGLWSVSTSGDLTYSTVSAVPLPAAAWLLLSGLAGLGAIGRRRSAALAAA